MISAEDAERDVEASRGELDRTMEAIRAKMTPGQLLDEAMGAAGGAGQQILSRFLEEAKANPMPLAVMGLGLAWLMTSNRKSQAGASVAAEPRSFAAGLDGPGTGLDSSGAAAGSGDGSPSLTDRLQSVAGSASDTVSGATDKLKHMGSQVGASASQTAHAAASKLTQATSAAADAASSLGPTAQQTAAGLFSSEPLLLGGLTLAVGFALGSALPSTDAEDQLLGQARDKVVDRTKSMVHDRVGDVADAAQAAYGEAKQALQNGDGDQSLADRARQAVQAGMGVVREHTDLPH